MSLPDKWIVFLGRPLRGHHHDDTRWQQALPPELDGLTDSHIRVDGGYLGMPADERGAQMDRPPKKPRKSQKNPSPALRAEQKAEQKA
jgi:hypothetical protein